MTPPRKFSALPPQDYHEASPKAISRRTSYLRVRLEFLPYPHLIATLFNGYGNFNLDMGRSPGFGSTNTDLTALFRLGIPSAPKLNFLTLPVIVTRRTVLQKVRGCTYKVLPQFVNTGFQVLFHSPPGVLFTVPSQYYSLSVTKEYLALRGGPRSFPQGSSCLVVLWILLCNSSFRIRDFHPLWLVFPGPFY